MIKHLVEIENYNDACGKCKYQIKSKHGYLCGIFNEPLPTELSNKYNCRCDDCLSLGYAYDGEEVISKKLQKFIATQTTELKAQAIVWHEYPDEIPAEAGVKCLVMLCGFTIMVYCGGLTIIDELFFKHTTNYEETLICKLETKRPRDYIEGEFYFGGGYIDTKPVFQFLTKQNEIYRIKTVNAEGLNIVFTDERQPALYYTTTILPGNSKIAKIISFPFNAIRLKKHNKYDVDSKILYLPKNSKPTGFLLQ